MIVIDKCNIKEEFEKYLDNIFRNNVPFKLFKESDTIVRTGEDEKLTLLVSKDSFKDLDSEVNFLTGKLKGDLAYYKLYCIVILNNGQLLDNFCKHSEMSLLVLSRENIRDIGTLGIQKRILEDEFYLNLISGLLLIKDAENDFLQKGKIYTLRSSMVFYPENNFYIDQLEKFKHIVLEEYSDGNSNSNVNVENIQDGFNQKIDGKINFEYKVKDSRNFYIGKIKDEIIPIVKEWNNAEIRQIIYSLNKTVKDKLCEFVSHFSLKKSLDKLTDLNIQIENNFKNNTGLSPTIIYNFDESYDSIVGGTELNRKNIDDNYELYKRKLFKTILISGFGIIAFLALSFLFERLWFLLGIPMTAIFFFMKKYFLFREFRKIYKNETNQIQSYLSNQCNTIKNSVFLFGKYSIIDLITKEKDRLNKIIDKVKKIDLGTKKAYDLDDIIKIYQPDKEIKCDLEKKDFLKITKNPEEIKNFTIKRIDEINSSVKTDFINTQFDTHIKFLRNNLPKLSDSSLPDIFEEGKIVSPRRNSKYYLFSFKRGTTQFIEYTRLEFELKDYHTMFVSLLEENSKP